MTFEEAAKLKAELAGLSVEVLTRFRAVLVRIDKAATNDTMVTAHTEEVLYVIDELVAEQDEQPETTDV